MLCAEPSQGRVCISNRGRDRLLVKQTVKNLGEGVCEQRKTWRIFVTKFGRAPGKCEPFWSGLHARSASSSGW